MPITLTITAETVSEFNSLVQALAGAKPERRKKADVEAERVAETLATEPAPAPELETTTEPTSDAPTEPAAPKETKRRGRPPKAETQPAPSASEPDPMGEPETPPPAEKIYTFDEVRAALVKLVETGHKDTALGIVEKIGGVSQVSKIDPSKFPAVMAAIEKAMP